MDLHLKTYETAKHLTYTPVNKETFAKWCESYMERIRAEREANKTEKDTKLTGRQLFEKNKNAFEDLVIEQEDTDESKPLEESKDEQDDDEDQPFVYDRALYEGADDLDEDVDFD